MTQNSIKRAENHPEIPCLLVDSSLPYLTPALEHVAEARFLPAEEISRKAILRHKAQGLLIRSVTKCDASLLEGTDIRFIGTATAGTDHIDARYCEQQGISVYNSAGCNAPAVAEYTFGALARFALKEGKPLKSYSLGVVGVGHVGREVIRYAKVVGMKVLPCDPPRVRDDGLTGYYSFENVLSEADIITFHVPLTTEGKDATFHLLDRSKLERIKRRIPLVVNAARGAVLDTEAFAEALRKGHIGHAIIDCWEWEPHINRELLSLAFVATPHIAGFSAESKARGSQMICQAMYNFFGVDKKLPKIVPPVAENPPIDASSFGENTLEHCLSAAIDLETPQRALRRTPEAFEQLRVNYHFHREPDQLKVVNAAPDYIESLKKLGFQCL